MSWSNSLKEIPQTVHTSDALGFQVMVTDLIYTEITVLQSDHLCLKRCKDATTETQCIVNF